MERTIRSRKTGRMYSADEVRQGLARQDIREGNVYEPTRSAGGSGLRSLRPNVAYEIGRMGRSLAEYDAMRAEEQRDIRAGRAVDDRTNAFKAYLRTGRMSTALEARDMGAATGAAGGFAVPPGRYEAELLLNLQYHSGVASQCAKLFTDTGSPMVLPLALSDTGNASGVVAENTLLATSDLALTRVVFGETPAWIASELLKVSNLLLNDATWNASAKIAQVFGQRVGAAVDAAFMSSILGNVNIPVVTTAGNAAITLADLENLFFTLDATYRGSDSVALIVSKSTAKAIRSIVDASGRAVVEDSEMVVEQSDTSLFGDDTLTKSMKVATFRGIKILESPNVGNITLSGVVGVVASWEDAFVMRVVTGSLGIARLVERYADYNVTAFSGFIRVDGNVSNFNAACLLRMSA